MLGNNTHNGSTRCPRQKRCIKRARKPCLTYARHERANREESLKILYSCRLNYNWGGGSRIWCAMEGTVVARDGLILAGSMCALRDVSAFIC